MFVNNRYVSRCFSTSSENNRGRSRDWSGGSWPKDFSGAMIRQSGWSGDAVTSHGFSSRLRESRLR